MLDSSFDYLKPYDEEDLIRLGKKNDGGYIISKKSISTDNCLLSFGMSYEWSFEEEFVSKNQNNFVHIYDHTVDLNFFIYRLYKSIKRLFYFKSSFKNIFNKTKELIKYFKLSKLRIKHFKKKISNEKSYLNKSLKECIDTINHDGKIMLKIDIEGDEFNILNDINLYAYKIHTLIIEFHHLDKNYLKFKEMIKYLNREFYIIHIHGNNYSECGKNQIPNTLEVTFLNIKMFFKNNKKSRKNFPIKNLDFPNDFRTKDIEINFEN